MQTTPHGEQVIQSAWSLLVRQFVIGNQSESFGAESRWVLQAQIPFQFCLLSIAVIPLLAGNLTRPAADALRNVDERRFDWGLRRRLGHDLLPLGVAFVATASRAFTTLTRHAFVS